MAHQRLAHMRNRSQTLSKMWRKGIDVQPEVIEAIQKCDMRMSEIITYVALMHSREMDDDFTTLNTVICSCQELADKIGIYNKETIRVNTIRLEEKGLIKIERGGLTNVYTLVGVKQRKFVEGIVRKDFNTWSQSDEKGR